MSRSLIKYNLVQIIFYSAVLLKTSPIKLLIFLAKLLTSSYVPKKLRPSKWRSLEEGGVAVVFAAAVLLDKVVEDGVVDVAVVVEGVVEGVAVVMF